MSDQLTKADEHALSLMPDGWFHAFYPKSYQVLRTEWRCERLHKLGKLERRLAANEREWEYRKVPNGVREGLGKVSSPKDADDPDRQGK